MTPLNNEHMPGSHKNVVFVELNEVPAVAAAGGVARGRLSAAQNIRISDLPSRQINLHQCREFKVNLSQQPEIEAFQFFPLHISFAADDLERHTK